MPPAPKHSRRRFQFRLSAILILMVIIGLCVGQIAATRRVLQLEDRNRELEATNSELRAEAGYLEVDEPGKVAVLRTRNLDDLSWQWKVWLPPGKWFLRIGNALDESNWLIKQVDGTAPMSAQSTDIAGDKAQDSFDPLACC